MIQPSTLIPLLVIAVVAVLPPRLVPAQCQLGKLVAPDASPSAHLGNPVALSGDRLLVGAIRAHSASPEAGAAYLFLRQGAIWEYDTKLVASDGSSQDSFGLGVALDDDVAVVGAYGHDGAGPDAGSAYVYRWLGGAWMEEAQLLASDADAGDNFGNSVGISGDTIVVGAPGDDEASFDAGAAFVFRHDGSAWVEEAKLTASDAAADDRFGWTVVIDDDVILMSAVRDDDDGDQSGSAYVFRRTGSTWNQEAKLTASDAAPTDWFSFSLWVDGDVAIFGAHFASFDAGKAYVFRRVAGDWIQEAILEASDAAPGDHFGLAVSIDGDRLLVGARRDDDLGVDSGSAYLFERQGNDWIETAKLNASDGAPQDHFGRAVALQGGHALVGAYRDDGMAGAAYIFWVEPGPDCDLDGEPDPCAVNSGSAADCNLNGTPDSCDIDSGTSLDADGNGIPDECEGPAFVRGDVNGSGTTLLNDAILLLNHLFNQAPLDCLDAGDHDDSGQILLNDAILLLSFLFSSGTPPEPPYPDCGPDVTPDAGGSDLGCNGPLPGCP